MRHDGSAQLPPPGLWQANVYSDQINGLVHWWTAHMPSVGNSAIATSAQLRSVIGSINALPAGSTLTRIWSPGMGLVWRADNTTNSIAKAAATRMLPTGSSACFTMCAWVYRRGGFAMNYFTLGSSNTGRNRAYIGCQSATQLNFGLNGWDTNGTVSSMANVWTHVAMTYQASASATTIIGYVNGVQVGTRNITTNTYTGDSAIAFGGSYDGGTALIDIADIRFYNTLKGPLQIQQMWSPGTRFDLYASIDSMALMPSSVKRFSGGDFLVGAW